MIKFFRKIRQKLITENRFSKYLIYAIGEIVLVMIGILLALQVNNWNTKKSLEAEEQIYLKEIKTSLNDDLKSIELVIAFNLNKAAKIDSTFQKLEQFSDPNQYTPFISSYMYILTTFQVFEPNKIAFENMISSENIGIISDTDLRNYLSLYYKKEFFNSTQERIKELTRQFTDYMGTIMFNKQTVKKLLNYDSQLPDISEITIHKDKQAYSYLFSMLMNINAQNDLLSETKGEIENLIALIDTNITS